MQIPTDEALGLKIKSIITRLAAVAVAVFVAGQLTGNAARWARARIMRLPASITSITTPETDDPAHPPVSDPDSNDRPGADRPQQSKAKSDTSGVGFV